MLKKYIIFLLPLQNLWERRNCRPRIEKRMLFGGKGRVRGGRGRIWLWQKHSAESARR